jgi:hypothetical protein
MTTLNEPKYPSDFLLGEADNHRSRQAGTFLAGDGATIDMQAGTVLGRILFAAPAGAAAGGNTGNGALTVGDLGRAAVIGVYTLTCIAAATNGGRFSVTAPDGTALQEAVVATAYANDHIGFTIADGGTDFAVGDSFTITVTAGSRKLVPVDQDAVNGSQRFAGIAYKSITVPDGTDLDGLIIHTEAVVKRAGLIWPSDIEEGEQAFIEADMAAALIQIRESA